MTNKSSLNQHSDNPLCVYIGPNKYVHMKKFQNEINNLYNFESMCTDIWITTFPRSGARWISELVWLIVNDFDYKYAREKNILDRIPFFERHLFIPENGKKIHTKIQPKEDRLWQTTIEMLNQMNSPRIINSHLPFSLLPPSVMKNKSKIIYVARNPRDVILSTYYFTKNIITIDKDFNEYYNRFEKNQVICGPYWCHLKEGWNHRDRKNVLFLFFGELKEELPKCIRKVADFLEIQLTESQITDLYNYFTYEDLKKRQSINYYCTGQFREMNNNFNTATMLTETGEWSRNMWPNEYTPSLIKKLKKWSEKNSEEIGITFPGW